MEPIGIFTAHLKPETDDKKLNVREEAISANYIQFNKIFSSN